MAPVEVEGSQGGEPNDEIPYETNNWLNDRWKQWCDFLDKCECPGSLVTPLDKHLRLLISGVLYQETYTVDMVCSAMDCADLVIADACALVNREEGEQTLRVLDFDEVYHNDFDKVYHKDYHMDFDKVHHKESSNDAVKSEWMGHELVLSMIDPEPTWKIGTMRRIEHLCEDGCAYWNEEESCIVQHYFERMLDEQTNRIFSNFDEVGLNFNSVMAFDEIRKFLLMGIAIMRSILVIERASAKIDNNLSVTGEWRFTERDREILIRQYFRGTRTEGEFQERMKNLEDTAFRFKMPVEWNYFATKFPFSVMKFESLEERRQSYDEWHHSREALNRVFHYLISGGSRNSFDYGEMVRCSLLSLDYLIFYGLNFQYEKYRLQTGQDWMGPYEDEDSIPIRRCLRPDDYELMDDTTAKDGRMRVVNELWKEKDLLLTAYEEKNLKRYFFELMWEFETNPTNPQTCIHPSDEPSDEPSNLPSSRGKRFQRHYLRFKGLLRYGIRAMHALHTFHSFSYNGTYHTHGNIANLLMQKMFHECDTASKFVARLRMQEKKSCLRKFIHKIFPQATNYSFRQHWLIKLALNTNKDASLYEEPNLYLYEPSNKRQRI